MAPTKFENKREVFTSVLSLSAKHVLRFEIGSQGFLRPRFKHTPGCGALLRQLEYPSNCMWCHLIVPGVSRHGESLAGARLAVCHDASWHDRPQRGKERQALSPQQYVVCRMTVQEGALSSNTAFSAGVNKQNNMHFT